MSARIEHKFVDLRQLKMTDNGPGTIEGYRSVAGVIDEGGDIVINGAFADSIPEYLSSGFSASSHSWSFEDSIGFPVEAREDGHGFFVVSQFHSTPAAQTVRTIAKERLAAGKTVGFSFGYKVDDYEFIQAKDFSTRLPQYIKPERLAENLVKAQRFPQIRILKKVSVIEDSLVTAPMNKLATATSAKSGRVFSGSNLSHMQRVHSDLGKLKKDAISVHADMSALIDKATPASLESGSGKSVSELRRESMRIGTEAIGILCLDGYKSANQLRRESALVQVQAMKSLYLEVPTKKSGRQLRRESERVRFSANRALLSASR
jgi:HK97 family phage prohead protease